MAVTKIVLLSDSTNGWFWQGQNPQLYLGALLYDRYDRTIRAGYNGSYSTPTWVDDLASDLDVVHFAGSAADEIHLYDNGPGGANWDDVDATAIKECVTDIAPDVVVIAFGMNGIVGLQAGLEGLYDDVVAAVPGVDVLFVAQNPNVAGDGQDDIDRRDATVAAANAKGAPVVDMYQVFVDYGDWEPDLVADGTHPTAAGLDLYAENVEAELLSQGWLGAAAEEGSAVAVLDSAELVLRANRYSGSGDWVDESGNGHDATPVGSLTWDGEKFILDGSTQYFTVPHDAGIDFAAADEFTVVVVAGLVAGTLFNKGRVNVAQHFYAMDASPEGASDRTRSLIADGATGVIVTLPDGPVSGEQATFAMRRTSTDLQAYLDGTFHSNTDTTADTLANAEDALIGARRHSVTGLPEGLFQGDIYGVALFTTALSDQEIEQAGQELTAAPAGPSNRMGGVGAIRRKGGPRT